MNKILFLLLIPIFLSSQSKVALEIKAAQEAKKRFTNVDMISRRLAGKDISALKVGVLAMSNEALNKLVTTKPNLISITVPKNARENVKLKLIKVDLLADGFSVQTNSGCTPYDPGIHYRGIVQGTNEIATLSIFKEGIIGNFSNEEQNITIAGLTNSIEVKKDTSIKFTCGSDKLPEPKKPLFKLESNLTPQSLESKCVKVYLECDYALFQNKGSTINTVNWITSVFNNVVALYYNEQINMKISEVFVWTAQDPYPKTSSLEALQKFKNTRTTFNGDLAHLAALGGHNLGGIAWLGTLCVPGYNYGYSNIESSFQAAPTYSWTVMVLAHELSHSLGGNHTQWCGWPNGAIDNCYATEGGCPPGPAPIGGGTILSYCHMTSYGINFNKGWGQIVGDKLRLGVSQAPCLQTNCGVTPPPNCGITGSLLASLIKTNSALITWSPVSGAANYNLEYKTSISTVWIKINTTLTNQTLTGLIPATTYNVRVQANCGGISSVISFTTLIPEPPPPPVAYCSSKSNSVNYEYLQLVKIGTINKISGKTTGYNDFTALTTDLTKGSTNTISYQAKTSGNSGTLYYKAWIDYNNDKDFTDPGEQIISLASSNYGILSSNFTVPNTAILGKTRLRIIMKYGGFALPCSAYSYGQTWDMSINIK